MMVFATYALGTGFGIAVIFFGAYALVANQLLNTPHANLNEWVRRLAGLSVNLPADRVTLEPPIAIVRAPLPSDALNGLETFIRQHRNIPRAERRLRVLRARGRFAVLSLILGLGFGVLLSAPVILGSQALWERFPLLVPVLVAAFPTVIVMLFGFPHSSEWDALKSASDRTPE